MLTMLLLSAVHLEVQAQVVAKQGLRKGQKPVKGQPAILKDNTQFSTAKMIPNEIALLPAETSNSLVRNDAMARKGIANLKKADQTVKIKWAKEQDIPYFITGTDLSPAFRGKSAAPRAIAKSFLTEHKSLFKIANPQEEFIVRTEEKDELGMTHIRMDQYFEGVPVWASDVVVHLNDNTVESFNGRYFPTPELETVVPYINASAAEHFAEEHFIEHRVGEGKTHDHHDHAHDVPQAFKDIIDFELPEPELVILPMEEGKKFHLAWHVSYFSDILHRYEYFIDAHSGEVIKQYYGTCTLGPTTGRGRDLLGQNRTLNLYEDNNNYLMLDASRPMYDASRSQIPNDPVGAILTLDLYDHSVYEINQWLGFAASRDRNDWSGQANAVSAHYNAGLCYEYFKNTHNRNALDGRGGTITSIVNITERNGAPMENAFWNGHFMAYGNGKDIFYPLAAALDVAGHEMSHGVIQSTANLKYEFQAGALNESFADVFGVMIDRDDWQVGEEVIKAKDIFRSGALRDVSDPHNGGSKGSPSFQPAHMNEYENLTINEDNGGVHINSGIPNKAFYNYAQAVGKEKAERVYYRALSRYLTQSSRFTDCRAAVVKSAQELYGVTEANAAREAFNKVGIVGSGDDTVIPDPEPEDLPQVQGDEHMIVHDASAGGDSFTLYDYNFSSQNLKGLTNRRAIRKPSVIENGTIASFVATDFNIYDVDLNTGGISALSDNNSWFNVASSPDGSKIAMISAFSDDRNIYVYDFNTQEQRSFELSNPSTAEGVSGGQPLFADHIEWDASGEFVMYDAYNLLKDFSGQSLDYYDIGVVKVWDKASNRFDDGRISKLFPSLPEGISIGNPTYAKNSSNIVCFDVYDSFEDQFGILAANVETGKVGTVVEVNNMFGYPSYSPDDKQIAFTSVFEGDTVVATISMGSDKITPSGNPAVLFTEGKWPVWYTRGERQFQKPNANFSVNTRSGAASLTVSFKDESSNSPTSWFWEFPGGNPATSTSRNPIVQYNQVGVYNVRLSASNPSGSDTETKTGYIEVFRSVGLEEEGLVESISVFPNPTSGSFQMDVVLPNTNDVLLEVFSPIGQELFKVKESRILSFHQQVDLTDFPSGIYLAKLTVGTESKTYKIFKE